MFRCLGFTLEVSNIREKYTWLNMKQLNPLKPRINFKLN